jgi:hypothetical protein
LALHEEKDKIIDAWLFKQSNKFHLINLNSYEW